MSNSFLLLLVRHLFLVAWHLLSSRKLELPRPLGPSFVLWLFVLPCPATEAFVDAEGHPKVSPMIYGRAGDALYLHGHLSAGLLRNGI